MDFDIDDALGRIGRQDAHPRLDGLEDRVITAINERPARTTARRTTLAGAGFALLLGVGSGIYPAPEARASQLAPFGVSSPLAPSTLLLGSQ